MIIFYYFNRLQLVKQAEVILMVMIVQFVQIKIAKYVISQLLPTVSYVKMD